MSHSEIYSNVPKDIWRSLVGEVSYARIPSINAYVYYLSLGHLEQSSNLQINVTQTFILCKAISVQFLCNKSSNQALVKYLLVPMTHSSLYHMVDRANERVQNDVISDVASFTKVLTYSDANIDSSFSVPWVCANCTFPPVDHTKAPHTQELKMRDVSNESVVWEFKHTYGNPHKQKISGWRKFLKDKRLVAGDSVVFMRRRSTNEMFIGLRRANTSGWIQVDDNDQGRNVANGMGFEVVYYPRNGVSKFVVSADRVDKAMANQWCAGMRVTIPIETSDSSERIWFNGTIQDASGSPWKMLKVIWDRPEFFKDAPPRVSPWEVEHEEVQGPNDTI